MPSNSTTTNNWLTDLQEGRTKDVIAALKELRVPWVQPWHPLKNGYLAFNPVTGKPYNGTNELDLFLKAQKIALTTGTFDPRWMTYKQAQSIGAQVRKGEKSTTIIYYKDHVDRVRKDEDGSPILAPDGTTEKERIELKAHWKLPAKVFHASQIDGLEPYKPQGIKYEWNPLEKADSILTASGVPIFHDQRDAAFYNIRTDTIHMPHKGQFELPELYYGTAMHELGHATGHPTKLNRNLTGDMQSEAYAREELRAEIASFQMCMRLGLAHDPTQHMAYVASWIKALEEQPLELDNAYRDAMAICRYIETFTPEKQKELTQELATLSPAALQRAPQIVALVVPSLNHSDTPAERTVEMRAHDLAETGIRLARQQFSTGYSATTEALAHEWTAYIEDLQALPLQPQSNPLHEWLTKAAQMATQEVHGGDDRPLHTAWAHLAGGIESVLTNARQAAEHERAELANYMVVGGTIHDFLHTHTTAEDVTRIMDSFADDQITTSRLQARSFQNMADYTSADPTALNMPDLEDAALLLDAVYTPPNGKQVLRSKIAPIANNEGRVTANIGSVFQMEICRLHPDDDPAVTFIPYPGKHQEAARYLRLAATIAESRADTSLERAIMPPPVRKLERPSVAISR